MPTSFLAAEQERRHGRYAGEPSADQLARCFHLDDADRALIATRRWDHMRLGFAVQLGTVRFLGAFLDDPADVPAGVAADLARQLGIDDPGCLARYRESRIRFQHAAEIGAQYGYREFADPAAGFRLVRWLYALCWTGSDRPGALFDRAVAWLLAHKVLLPGATVLERLVARVRARAAQRLWRAIARGVAATQRAKLDALLLPGEGGRQSAFDRLRDGPVLQSPAELGRAVKRLEEVRALAEGLPPADRVPPGRVAALARHAGAARAQAVARMPEERRAATLLAYVRTLEATAQDDVLDLFDAVVTRLSADAEAAGERARLRTLRDLDAVALCLGQACAVLLDEDTPDTAVRAAAFEAVTPDALRAAMARVVELARPEEGSPYVAELREQARRLQFLPALLRAVRFAAAPAARPVLDAVEHLRALAEGRPAGKPPLAWVPKGWRDEVVRADGGVDMAAYRVCLLLRVRAALRRRDLHTEPSLRYADPRKGLLEGRRGKRPARRYAAPSACPPPRPKSWAGSGRGSTPPGGRRPGCCLRAPRCGCGPARTPASCWPRSTGWTSRRAWWRCGPRHRPGCRGWTCRRSCWRSTPAPASSTPSPTRARPARAPRGWRRASARCCWPRPATPASNRWRAPTSRRCAGRGWAGPSRTT